MPENASETGGLQVLLDEIQRTISDNKLFLLKLKSDTADSELDDKHPEGVDSPEDDFEEL